MEADRPWESLPVDPLMAVLTFTGWVWWGWRGGRVVLGLMDGPPAAALATLLGVGGPGSAGQGQAEGREGSW